jgi:uncharacterized membrane protein
MIQHDLTDHKILNNLAEAGYVERTKHGRRNHYTVRTNRPMRHPP